LLLVAYKVHFPAFLHRKLRFESLAVQCSEHSNSLCLPSTIAFIRLMPSSRGLVCCFDVFACQKW
jgi:hypothetical protein